MPVQRDFTRVVFVDRDGVINRDRDDYVKSVAEFEFLPGTPEALARLYNDGWTLFIVSNQASIAKGLMSLDELDRINEVIRTRVAEAGGMIEKMYYCPHHPDEKCACRKPLPGMLHQARQDYGIELSRAVFVGDAERDIMAGKAAGCKTVLVLSGKLTALDAAEVTPAPDHIAVDLSAAADWITAGNV